MKDALQESTNLLAMFLDYASYNRNRVFVNPDLAKRGGFTYIDLDLLDEISVRISQNVDILKKKGK